MTYRPQTLTSRAAQDPWIAFRKPRPQARLRLFCFPYAGGGALIYRSWVEEIAQEIEVCPVQLPGRERRLREAAHTRMEPLVDALVPALQPYLDIPFAFFGHSMGATIAFEVAQRLRRQGLPGPEHLIASARRAPQVVAEDIKYYLLGDDEFRQRLREIEGTPEEVLDSDELMELVMPLLRADFELVDTYPPSDLPPLDCPITVFGGLGDPEVHREELEAWCQATNARCRLRMFPGSHFFLHDHRETLLRAIEQHLLA